jgi:hypothetical protein
MLKIKSYLATSKVHGIGLFAGENVKEGSIVWQFNSHIDQVFTIRKFRTISSSVNHFGLQHLYASSYKRNDKYYYITDNARFINHSNDHFNILFTDDFTEIACHDINKDEEILENYFLSYDRDDFFYFELHHLNVDHYLALNGKDRKTYVKNQNIS